MKIGVFRVRILVLLLLGFCFVCESPLLASVSGQPLVPYDLGEWIYVSKPVYPLRINASQISIGANWTYVYNLEANHTYHVYCYGAWIDSDPLHNKTDYDIFVYDPFQEQISYHTEAAGLPEHLGTTVDQPYFTPRNSGNHSFLIVNDPRESQGAEEATFMLIEHVDCGQWYESQILGKIDDVPVENTSRAYEFSTTSQHVEVSIDVPDTLDMYEARLYLMANPSEEIGISLNDVPLSWEPGLYGNRSGIYGGYNLDSRGFRQADAMASCEYPGQDMLINYTSPDIGNTLYHLVLIGEDGVGEVDFRIKTDFKAPTLDILNPPETAPSTSNTTIIAVANDAESGLEQVLLNYTTTDLASWSSVHMALAQNQTYKATIPRQSPGTVVTYEIVAFDEVENYARVHGSFAVKEPSNLTCVLSNSALFYGEEIVVTGLISHGDSAVIVNYTCSEVNETRVVYADIYGEFADTYSPTKAGSWSMVAEWSGNETCFGSSSVPLNFTVLRSPISISCYISSEEITIGEEVVIMGQVEPCFERMDVTLIFQRSNGSLIKEHPNIQSNGTFITSFQPDSLGSWRVQAQLEGDDSRYLPASSDLLALNVIDTWIERYKFYMVGGAVGLVAVVIIYMKRLRGT